MGKKALILNYKILLQHFVASSSQLSYIDTRKEGINLPACLSVCLSVCLSSSIRLYPCSLRTSPCFSRAKTRQKMEVERMFVKCDKHHHKLLQCLAPDKLNFQAYKVSGRCYR